MEDRSICVAYAAVLLWLLTAGCAHVKPGAQQPAAEPAASATPQPAPAAAPAPNAKTPAAQAAGKATPPVARTPAVPPALDLNALETQLKETKAIGFLTKITLKNQVDDLLNLFREYYQGKAKLTMTDLRRSYDLLMMKVLSLLQDEDQKLASDIVSSREAIWGLLADPKKFATFQG
jgi:hypothetical protein